MLGGSTCQTTSVLGSPQGKSCEGSSSAKVSRDAGCGQGMPKADWIAGRQLPWGGHLRFKFSSLVGPGWPLVLSFCSHWWSYQLLSAFTAAPKLAGIPTDKFLEPVPVSPRVLVCPLPAAWRCWPAQHICWGSQRRNPSRPVPFLLPFPPSFSTNSKQAARPACTCRACGAPLLHRHRHGGGEEQQHAEGPKAAWQHMKHDLQDPHDWDKRTEDQFEHSADVAPRYTTPPRGTTCWILPRSSTPCARRFPIPISTT